MLRRALLSAFVVVGCQREPARPTVPLPRVPAVVVSAAPPPRADAGASGVLVWRVLRHVFVESDGGVPIEMSITVQLEVGGKVMGPFTFGEPGCTLGVSTDDPHVVSGLTCYYAGGGEYVEVREKAPGDYEVVAYAQSESYPDEPLPPKVGTRTLGAFHATLLPQDELVAADGGRYAPYESSDR